MTAARFNRHETPPRVPAFFVRPLVPGGLSGSGRGAKQGFSG